MKKNDSRIDQRMQILLTKQERKAVERLSAHDGVTMGHAIRAAIRAAAKKKKVWS